MVRSIVILLSLIFLSSTIVSQSKFDFQQMIEVDGQQLSFEAFRGKPLILEFFTSYCTVCFRKLPELNVIQRRFSDNLAIILIGNDSKKLPGTFDRFRKKYNLKLKTCFDSSFFYKYNPPFAPFYLWVDANGIIQGTSGPELVKDTMIELFLSNNFSFFQKSEKRIETRGQHFGVREERLWKASIFVKANDSINIVYPSIFSVSTKQPFLEFRNVSLSQLSLGVIFSRFEWSRKDEEYSRFWPWVVDNNVGRVKELLGCRVSYLLCLPEDKSSLEVRKYILEDIENCFGLDFEIKDTVMPCWRIRLADTSKSKFRRSAAAYFSNYSNLGSLNVSNCYFDKIIDYIVYRTGMKVPIFNETGLNWPIDLEFEAIMTDWGDVKVEMEKKGFIFETVLKKMRVVFCKNGNEASTGRF